MGKTILITGSSSGIGAALAAKLADQGHFVIATARNPAKIAASLKERLNVATVQLDVVDTESVAQAVTSVASIISKEGLNGLDVLVNNAGVGYTMPLLDVDIDEAKKVYEVQVWGMLRVTQAFANMIISSKGRIVNVSSTGSMLNTPWIGECWMATGAMVADLETGTYASAKCALNMLSETLRAELMPFGVDVVDLLTGRVLTPFHENQIIIGLPKGSRYLAIEDTICKWEMGEVGPPKGALDKYIDEIVPVVLGGNGVVWKGAHVWMVWLSSVLPTFLTVSLLCFVSFPVMVLANGDRMLRIGGCRD